MSTNYVYLTDKFFFSSGDVDPPYFAGWSPAKSATGVSIATNIYFEVEDNDSGVDEDTITVTVEGANAILLGVFQTGYTGSIVDNGGGGFDVTIIPDANFSLLQVVNVVLNADDIDGNSATPDSYSFTCADWSWPGLTPPSIVYDGNTISFPVPVRCRFNHINNVITNIGLNKSLEFVGKSYPLEMAVSIGPLIDAAFDTAMNTFFKNWAGKKKWFDFTSGQAVRYDGDWLLKTPEMRPRRNDNGTITYDLVFERKYQ